MLAKLRTLLLVAALLLPVTAARALEDAFVVLPETTVAAATTTMSVDIDGTYLPGMYVFLTISGITGSQTVQLQLFFWDMVAEEWYAVVTTGTVHSTNGAKVSCASNPVCAQGAIPAADRWTLNFPRRFRFGVVTTTADSVTFEVVVVPAH